MPAKTMVNFVKRVENFERGDLVTNQKRNIIVLVTEPPTETMFSGVVLWCGNPNSNRVGEFGNGFNVISFFKYSGSVILSQ